MKRVIFVLFLLASVHRTVLGQTADSSLNPNGVVERVDISGVGEDRLSSALREDLQKLTGQKFDSLAADELSDRIQDELPEYVAAAKTLPGSRSDAVRVMFVVAHISEDD